MAKVCIICEKEPQGKAFRVRDDFIVKTVRSIKQRLGIAKNNELYVDQACMPVYKEKRKKFERNAVFYTAAAVIIFVILNALQIWYGKFSIVTFLATILLGLFISALAVLNYATPPVDESPSSKDAEVQFAKEQTKQKKAQYKPKKK